jgi:hypothetical protein
MYMFDLNPYQFPEATELSGPGSAGGTLAERAVFRIYRRAQRRGWLAHTLASMTGRATRLRDLAADVRAGAINASRSLGLQSVSIDMICGSEGRSVDFDVTFRPLQTRTWDRWRAIALAWQRGETLPPVELIRIGARYYVRDGHHRISVARAFGQPYIDAQVTVWQVDE